VFRLTLLLLLASLLRPLVAQQGAVSTVAPPPPWPEAAAHAPRPLPDRIVFTWRGDPATTQAVTWRTDTSVQRAVAEIAVARDNGPELTGPPGAATTETLTSDLGVALYHHIEFTGLVPGTLYAGRVGDGVNWSGWFHFRTASREPRPFTFVCFGDVQNDIRALWSRVAREAFRAAPRAAFTLYAGDLVGRGNRDADWGEWFAAADVFNTAVPVAPVPGNHEYFQVGAGPVNQRQWETRDGRTIAVTMQREPQRDVTGRITDFRITARGADGREATAALDDDERFVALDAGFTALTGFTIDDLRGREAGNPPLRDRLTNPGVRTFSHHWRAQFSLPENGVPGLEETNYWFDYQGLRIVALNSNEKQEEQAVWLRAVLRNNPSRWTIVAFHHPIFSVARNRDNARLRSLWKPVLDDSRVDLVFNGHDHVYARSGAVAGNGQVHDPVIGTVYVVSVSGPKMYDLTANEWAVRTAKNTQLFQVVTIDGEELRFEARTATGRLHDAFLLRKRPGQANQLVELPVETPPPAP
jgi:hypothetical protein